MGRQQSYTDEEFIEAVKTSLSIRQVLSKLGLVEAGGNYRQVKRKAKILGVDLSHFTGQAHLKGQSHSWAKKISLDDILVKDSTYNGHLRQRLLKEKIFDEKCYKCGITEWLGQRISLELEHKNGDRFDNRIENLIILCPNCHSQTKYYRGRNKKNHRFIKRRYFCVECKRELNARRKTGLCIDCIRKKNK